MKLKREIEIEIPRTPNFIMAGGTTDQERDRKKIPIHELTETDLREIGRQWTEALVEEAGKKRVEASTLIR